LGAIRNFPEEEWDQPIKDERNTEPGTGVSFKTTVEGLIQHDIYHAAQVALLNKIING